MKKALEDKLFHKSYLSAYPSRFKTTLVTVGIRVEDTQTGEKHEFTHAFKPVEDEASAVSYSQSTLGLKFNKGKVTGGDRMLVQLTALVKAQRDRKPKPPKKKGK